MKKTFTLSGTEYTVRACTAICKSIGESKRRKALYIYNISESGEITEYVVFGYHMPKDEAEFLEMSKDSSAWDGWYETTETVQITE